MRTLLATTRGAGHYGPLRPVARAVADAGHEFLVAGPRSAAAMVRADGFEVWEVDDASDEDRGAVFGALSPETSIDEGNALVVREIFGRLATTAALPGMQAAVEAWRPDVVARDALEFASALAAEPHGIPVARVSAGLGLTEHWALPLAAPALEDVRAAQGLPPDPECERLRGGTYLTLAPASLEDPDAPAPPGTVRFHEAPPPAADRTTDPPLVFVTFGSVVPTMGFYPDLYNGVVGILAGAGLRVLVAVGRDVDPAALEPLRDGVRVEPWVDQPAVLASASAMVHHGGFGSMLAGAASGVPQVVLPLFADQAHNARRVQAVGAGIALEGGPAAVGGLAEAVDAVLGQQPYADGAARLAAEIAALPPASAAVAALEALARAR